MPPFSDPVFRAEASARSLAKRRAWRELKFDLRTGARDLEQALADPAAQDRTLVEVVGLTFPHGTWKGERTPQPHRSRATALLRSVSITPQTRVSSLSDARREQLVAAWRDHARRNRWSHYRAAA